ncbi:unnamed protein product [Soboliphyme baturini]|uniref:Innexin n=1 Tax=Soboliphyme baturini TaxID=241478 RepID=A0A183J3C7_9BILA|nr:unnamed protein product [Soboliphyme baturini]
MCHIHGSKQFHNLGIRIRNILEEAMDSKNLVPEARRVTLHTLMVHLENALKFHRRLQKRNITPHKILRLFNLPYSSFYVTVVYTVVKLLYMGNVVMQFLLMNFFLQHHTGGFYGWDMLSKLLNGTEWDSSGFFPRVSLCDFEVRVMGNIQHYTVQCVLVINIFNEKIFLFLWFWYHCLSLITASSALYWAVVSFLPFMQRWFVERNLELSELPFDRKESAKDVERFVASYLRIDGVFVLRLINLHSGIIFSSDLVAMLWQRFYGIEVLVQERKGRPWPKIAELSSLIDKTVAAPHFADEVSAALRQRQTLKPVGRLATDEQRLKAREAAPTPRAAMLGFGSDLDETHHLDIVDDRHSTEL